MECISILCKIRKNISRRKDIQSKKNFSKPETKENTAQQQAENLPQDIVFLFCLYAVAMVEFFKNKTLTRIQKHRFTALTKAFFMPVLEAPPPPAVMTNPVLGSTLMEYRGKGALYKSGTFLFHIVAEKAGHAFSKEQTAASNHTYEITYEILRSTSGVGVRRLKAD